MGLYLAPHPPERVLHRMDLRNFFFRIPPGDANHEVTRCYTFEKDKLLLSITPHMHFRGKDARYELTRPNGKHDVLLFVPNYNFYLGDYGTYNYGVYLSGDSVRPNLALEMQRDLLRAQRAMSVPGAYGTPSTSVSEKLVPMANPDLVGAALA